MIRLVSTVVALTILAAVAFPLVAHPNYLVLYEQDPFRKLSVSGCGACHLDPQGGGPRNEFGVDFEASGFTITPMLRANHLERFDISLSAQLPNGGRIYFSDPAGQFLVFEKNRQKHLLDVNAVVEGRLVDKATVTEAPTVPALAATAATVKEEVAPKRHPIPNFSFFVTSVGIGDGGNLGGLAGADRHCQQLAASVNAGYKTWQAYLSTSIDGEASVNAGDRIGSGPWYNAKGMLVARGVADLHGNSQIDKNKALNEKGELVNQHDILTGTNPDGTAAIGKNCENWTSNSSGTAVLGHFDRQTQDGDPGTSWNSSHPSKTCSVKELPSAGLLYCFAIDGFKSRP